MFSHFDEIHLNRLCISLQRVSDEINIAAQHIAKKHSHMDGESKPAALLKKFNVNNLYDGCFSSSEEEYSNKKLDNINIAITKLIISICNRKLNNAINYINAK